MIHSKRRVGKIDRGNGAAAVDATCCRIMRIDPTKIEYLKIERGAANLLESLFRQIGEPIRSVRTQFHLIDP